MTVVMKRPVDLGEIAEDPRLFCCMSYEEIFSIPQAELEDLYEHAVPRHFERMRHRIKALDVVAEQSDVKQISGLNDIVPVLFPHTMAKSYPLSFIEKGRFDRMNAWIDNLTAHDLSKLDLSECDSLDSWIHTVESQTPARIYCSSGTTGKMSFNNTSREEDPFTVAGFLQVREKWRDEPGYDLRANPQTPMVCPYVKRGATGVAHRYQRVINELYNGDETKVIALNGTINADMLWLAGVLRGAESRGELAKLKLTPALERLRAQLQSDQNAMPERMSAFFERIIEGFGNDPVVMFMPWPRWYEFARLLKDRGIKFRLPEGSYVFAGGGLKGIQLPDGWRSLVRDYFGDITESYGMSEITGGVATKCGHGHYHMIPAVISFVLDPQTSQPLPRKGKQTGRYAFLDLNTSHHWGGLITGDQVTMDWDGNCGCGRVGPYIEGDISRFGASHGDDKISCAKTPEAYDNAVEYLLGAE